MLYIRILNNGLCCGGRGLLVLGECIRQWDLLFVSQASWLAVFVYLCIFLSACLSVCLCIFLSVCASLCLSFWVSVCLIDIILSNTICLFVLLPDCLSAVCRSPMWPMFLAVVSMGRTFLNILALQSCSSGTEVTPCWMRSIKWSRPFGWWTNLFSVKWQTFL